MIDLTIAVERQRIHGKLLAPPSCDERCPAALFVHGWGDTQRRNLGVGKQLRARGFACLTFNLRGHAGTRAQRDSVTRAQNLADVIAAYDVLAARPEVDAARIGAVGSSYGGYLATLLTAERKVSWLALHAPALYMDADFDRPKRELNLDPKLAAYRRRRLEPGANRALTAASRFAGDVLVVESEVDAVIPHPVVANYLRAFEGAASRGHEVLAGADHGLSHEAWRREWGARLVDWVATRAVGGRAA
jgi:alpha-beta hydrolase superfamily lysophospholipase